MGSQINCSSLWVTPNVHITDLEFFCANSKIWTIAYIETPCALKILTLACLIFLQQDFNIFACNAILARDVQYRYEPKQNELYGTGSGAVQLYPYSIKSSRTTCSLVYLSIILYPANIVPLRQRLDSIAWQVHLRSLQCILLVRTTHIQESLENWK